MVYFLLGLALFLMLILGARYLVRADPKVLAQNLRRIGGVAALVLATIFAVTGRFALAVPLAALGAMLFGRSLPGIPFPGGFNPFPGSADKTAGQQSRVRTAFLEMLLDHDTGAMDGQVIQGQFAGSLLSDLAMADLIALWQECRGSDAQSGQLLEAYLDHRDTDWRDAAGAGAAGSDEPGGAPAGGRMSVEEAYEILGLAPGASKQQIRRAHRTLMKKLHPDQGGSTYLAAKINQAKDLLLG